MTRRTIVAATVMAAFSVLAYSQSSYAVDAAPARGVADAYWRALRLGDVDAALHLHDPLIWRDDKEAASRWAEFLIGLKKIYGPIEKTTLVDTESFAAEGPVRRDKQVEACSAFTYDVKRRTLDSRERLVICGPTRGLPAAYRVFGVRFERLDDHQTLKLGLMTPKDRLDAAPSAERTGPRVLSVSGGEPVYVVSTAQDSTRHAYVLRYHLGFDTERFSTPEARDREVERATKVFESLEVWCATHSISEVSIEALAGSPGAAGRALRVYWRRTQASSWKRLGDKLSDVSLPEFSPAPTTHLKDTQLEVALLHAAEKFLACMDRADPHAAWLEMSTRAREAVPESALAAQLTAQRGGNVPLPTQHRPVSWTYQAASGAAGNGPQTAVVRFVTTHSTGQGSEDVTLTMEAGAWRVEAFEPIYPAAKPK